MAQGSNQPPDSSLATAQARTTSLTSGGACASVISPRRSLLIALPGFQVLNTASACCRMSRAAARPALISRPALPSAV